MFGSHYWLFERHFVETFAMECGSISRALFSKETGIIIGLSSILKRLYPHWLA
jgi:hypothetical protein